jgi:hypothetical protein
MKIYYIERRPCPYKKDIEIVNCFYKEDLRIAYHDQYPIKIDDVGDFTFDDPFLPYLIIDGEKKEIYTSTEKENWKEDLIASGKYSKKMEICPLTREEYENKYAPTVYYIRERDYRRTMFIYSVYRKDIETIYPGYEIFSSKYDFFFARSSISTLKYFLEEDGYRITYNHPAPLSNWKEDLIINRSNKDSQFSIFPIPNSEQTDDYVDINEFTIKALVDKSIQEFCEEYKLTKELEREKYASYYNYCSDSEEDNSDPDYCGACGESPCMCSDPERTSTISYY